MDKIGRKRLSWEETCLRLAYDIANYRSQDPHYQVGACALKKDGNNFVLGYNGCLPGHEIDWSDRDERRSKVIHAEANVLNRILPGEVEFIALTASPCPECIKVIGQKQIKKVIYSEVRHDLEQTKKFADEFGIELKRIIIESGAKLVSPWKEPMKDVPKINIPIKFKKEDKFGGMPEIKETYIHSQPECPFNYCDQEEPYTACIKNCRHRS